MYVMSLSENECVTLNQETEIEIVEIKEDSVRIAIRSATVSPYYWERELACGSSHQLTEMMSM